jgi:predicted enzyme related to lactoylglutathione lyase
MSHRDLVLSSVLAVLVTSAAARVQLPAPNAAGVAPGHIHLTVPDVAETQKLWADVLGGQTMAAGPLQMVKLPGIFVIITNRAAPSGGTEGSAVSEVGFLVRDLAAITGKAKTAGLALRDSPAGEALVMFPHDIAVRLREDRSLATPVAFQRFQLSAPDTDAARAWYAKVFGATASVTWVKSAAAPAPSRGRALDHIGFEVKDLQAFLKKLEADGVPLTSAYRDVTATIGLKIAFLTDPNGTYIELTEGLAAK